MEQHRREGPALKYKNEMQMHLLNLFRPPKAYFLKNKDLVDSNGCLLKHQVP
jgi:hypothetical protein